MVTTQIRMACRAETEGRGRCRHMVDGAGKCPQHRDGQAAPRPNKVLFKARVNPRWIGRLEQAGVAWHEGRNEEALKDKHRDEAQSVGRSPTAYRSTPDSGVAVFGQPGAQMVNASGLLGELMAQGYVVTDIHLYRRPGQDERMASLSIELTYQGKDAQQIPHVVLELITLATWETAHVWANPPKADGNVIHTVNLVHRQPDLQAHGTLVFDGGLWNINPQE